ncbi:MSF1-domain-containing protein [Martensiomyces pterosporus]|nr:MSF1-domain-containing protein [Martensiomyces pterosporus]
MVKFYQQKFSYDYSWNTVSYAFINRYPNPFATHVLTADTIDHRINPHTGELHITRLLRKTNSVPRWAKGIMRGNDAYILEEVVVNRQTGTLVAKTRNITHTRLMKVEEKQTLFADPSAAERTLCKNETSIVSNIGYGLNSKIENFSLSRFSDNIAKSRKGMLYVLDMAQRKGLLRPRVIAEKEQ